MIREILEKNGFNFTEYDDYFYNTIYIHKNNIDIDNYYNNSIEDYEFASRCYVKENGFKLSWLYAEFKKNCDDDSKCTIEMMGTDVISFNYEDYKGRVQRINLFLSDDKITLITPSFRSSRVSSWSLFKENSAHKLTAWLFANDIKIINDLKEK